MRMDAMELLMNQEFAGEFAKVGNVADAKQLFENNGVALTEEELVEVLEKVSKEQKEVNAELTEDDMENVSGGAVVAFAVGLAAGILINEYRRKKR